MRGGGGGGGVNPLRLSRVLNIRNTFTTGGSFAEAQSTLAVQAQKGIFTLNKYQYLYKFYMYVFHRSINLN